MGELYAGHEKKAIFDHVFTELPYVPIIHPNGTEVLDLSKDFGL